MNMQATIDNQLSPLQRNARDLDIELEWFAAVLSAAFDRHFNKANTCPPPAPDFTAADSAYGTFVSEYKLSLPERCALLLALVPHVRPRLLDGFYLKNSLFDRKYTEFGGIYGGPLGDFTPTGETLAFILANNDLAVRFSLLALFDANHFFRQQNILSITPSSDESPLKAALQLSSECLSRFTSGTVCRPDFGPNFPARLIESSQSWDDLVLQAGTRKQIEEIKAWAQYGSILMQDWGMAKKLRPGYRSLFYGPPGTGKTMTACLLGKATGRDVYKIDLSQVVSKYIGETEKNLGKVFDQAQNKGWILFFDEADALFGKRSDTKSSNDRYANQEVAFLLQRIETFDGIAILATNLRGNMDEAFARRFESMIYFPLPPPEQRLHLWRQGFSAQATLDSGLNLEKIAHDHALAGGAIINVIRYASMEAIRQQRTLITYDDVHNGIRREYSKEGKGV